MPRARWIAACIAVLIPATASSAQSVPGRVDDEQICLGFSFGTWKPALNWRAAGHGDFPDSSRLQHAPGGRDWAATAGDPDSTLMLYPAWWPVGVSVTLPTRSPAAGDTITGDAIAFRANVDSVAPRTRVRAWRVSCGASRAFSKP